MYDLKKDPGQTVNVITAHRDRAAGMREDLATRLEHELPTLKS